MEVWGRGGAVRPGEGRASRLPPGSLCGAAAFSSVQEHPLRAGVASGTGKLHLSVLAFLRAAGGASISRVGEELPCRLDTSHLFLIKEAAE